MGTTIGDLLSASPYSGVPLEPSNDGLELWDSSEPSGSQSKGLTIEQLFRNYDPVALKDEQNTFSEPQEIDTGSSEPPFNLGADQQAEKVTGLNADQVNGRDPEVFVEQVSDLRNLDIDPPPGAFVDTLGARSGQFLPSATDPFGQGDDGAITAQNGNGNWWIRQKPFEEGVVNARWFGMEPSASASTNQTALQEAINTAANIGISIVFIPAGTYEITGPVYVTYDSSNNPNYPNDNELKGQTQITGRGVPNIPNLRNDNNTERGTILRFRNTSGSCFKGIETGGGDSMRGLMFRNFGMSSETQDIALDLQGTGQFAGLNKFRLLMYDAAGDGVRWRDAITGSFNRAWIANDPGPGSGIGFMINNPNGGGLVDITQMTVESFDTGYQVGESASASIDQVQLYGCQAIGNNTGLRLRYSGLDSYGCWFEDNNDHDVWAYQNSIYRDYGSRSSSLASTANFRFGDDAGATNAEQVGNGMLYGTRAFRVTTKGVRIEGSEDHGGVLCVATEMEAENDNQGVAYSVSSSSLHASVISPEDIDFGNSFQTYYENQSYFDTIIDGNRGIYSLQNLPTSQPATSGQLWNDGGTLKVA